MSGSLDVRASGMVLPVATATPVTKTKSEVEVTTTPVTTTTTPVVTADKAKEVLKKDGLGNWFKRLFNWKRDGFTTTSFTAQLNTFAKAQLEMATKTNALFCPARPVRNEAVKSLAGRVVALAGNNNAAFVQAAKEMMTQQLEKAGLSPDVVADAHQRLDEAVQTAMVDAFVKRVSLDAQSGNLENIVTEEAHKLANAGIFSSARDALEALNDAIATQRVQSQYPASEAGNKAFDEKLKNLKAPQTLDNITNVRLKKEEAELKQLVAKRNAIYNAEAAAKVTDPAARRAGLSADEVQAFTDLAYFHSEFRPRYLNGTLSIKQKELLKAHMERNALAKASHEVTKVFGQQGVMVVAGDSRAYLGLDALRPRMAALQASGSPEDLAACAKLETAYNEYMSLQTKLVAADKKIRELTANFHKLEAEFVELDGKVLAQQALVDNKAAIARVVEQEADMTVAYLTEMRARHVTKVSKQDSLTARVMDLARAIAILDKSSRLENCTAEEVWFLNEVLGEPRVQELTALAQANAHMFASVCVGFAKQLKLESRRLEAQLKAMDKVVNLD